jgi:HEAT repeat protein
MIGVTSMKYSDHVAELIGLIDCQDPDGRVAAIEALGEIGDEEALKVLRARLRLVNREMSALVNAVGKMKRRLKVK